MDAMASGRAQGSGGRLGQLWQLPLLLVSLGLFAYAAYLFFRPFTIGPTVEQRIERIQSSLKNERPEAALEQIRYLRQTSKLSKEADAAVHLLQAEATELLQRVKKQDLPANHTEIIEQTRLRRDARAIQLELLHQRCSNALQDFLIRMHELPSVASIDRA